MEPALDCAGVDADSAMCGLPELRFATTAAPASKRWRQLERVGRPGSSDENRQGSRLPVRAAKTGGANRKAADHVAVTAAFVAELRRASKPGRVFCATAEYI